MAVSRSRSLRNLEALRLQARLGPPDEPQQALVAQSPDTQMAQIDSRHVGSLELLGGGRGANRLPGGVTEAATTNSGFTASPSKYQTALNPPASDSQGTVRPESIAVNQQLARTPSLHSTAALKAHTTDELAAITKNPNNLFASPATKAINTAQNVARNVIQYQPRNLIQNPELLKKGLLGAKAGLTGAKAGIAKAAGAGVLKTGSIIKAILSFL